MLLQELTDLNAHGARDIATLAKTWEPILDRFPGWFWATDANYRLTYLSDNIGRITKTSREDLIGLYILDADYGDVRTEAGIAEYYDLLLKQEAFYNVCYERNLVEGKRIVFMDSGVPIFDADGRFAGYHGISLHVSHATEQAGATSSLVFALKNRADALEEELSRRNAELEAKNELLIEVLEAMGEGLMVTSGADLYDPNVVVEIVNPAYRKLFGLGPKDVQIGTSIPDLVGRLIRNGDVPNDPAKIDKMVKDMQAERPIVMDLGTQKKTTSVASSKRKDGGLILVHTDVTNLRSQNVKLEKALHTAEVATAAKSNFLATMSHEIRTPMNGIVGMADLLAETALSAEQNAYVETIRSSAQALTNLITDILDFSKIEADRLKLDIAPFVVRDFISEISGLVSGLARAKGLEFVVEIDRNVPQAVTGDSFRVRQILLNLLGNAVKFSLKGQVGLSVQTSAEQGGLTFCVTDTGIGIPDDMLEHIFTPFEQVEGGLRRGFEGSGLGLAITRDLVQAMEGDIRVTSQTDVGSTFTVELTLPEVALDRAIKHTAAPMDTVRLEGLRVLVAEDNKTNQLVVRRMLERAGVEITTANNGIEACALFAAQQFDLVLMDVSMPKMSGLEAAQAIRTQEAQQGLAPCPIVALTGNAFDKDRASAFEAGMDDFLAKPVRLRQLLECLSRNISTAEGKDPGAVKHARS